MKLALRWHPDKWVTKSEEERKAAEEKFKEISIAYSKLLEQERSLISSSPSTNENSNNKDQEKQKQKKWIDEELEKTSKFLEIYLLCSSILNEIFNKIKETKINATRLDSFIARYWLANIIFGFV